MSKLTTVTLLKPHRHAGRNYPPQAVLQLPDHKAQWLVGLGVARTEPVQTTTTRQSSATATKE